MLCKELCFSAHCLDILEDRIGLEFGVGLRVRFNDQANIEGQLEILIFAPFLASVCNNSLITLFSQRSRTPIFFALA